MRLTFYSLVMGVALSISAQAQDLTPTPLTGAPFDTLLKMAQESLPADFNAVQGMYTGRCFYKSDPQTRLSSLALFSERSNVDRGPLFPPQTPRIVELLWSRSPDNQTAASILRNSLPYRNTHVRTMSPLVFSTTYPNGRTLDTEVLQHEDYILTITRPARFTHGFVVMACYYFNKIN